MRRTRRGGFAHEQLRERLFSTVEAGAGGGGHAQCSPDREHQCFPPVPARAGS